MRTTDGSRCLPVRRLSLAACVAVLAACTTAPPASPDMAWVAQARSVATAVPPKLVSVLQEEIARSGHEGAVQACSDKAPAMAREASAASGWNVKRVSLRNRNPQAVPDAWERAVLEDFDRRAAARVPPAQLERAEVVFENGKPIQRYMRALPVVELCTNCHGTPDRIAPAVAARIKTLYPQDRGTGYGLGDIRGAITLRRPAS